MSKERDLYEARIRESQEKFVNLRVEIFQLLYKTNYHDPEAELKHEVNMKINTKIDDLLDTHRELLMLCAPQNLCMK